MLDGEILKLSFEPVTVRTSYHNPYHNRMIVLQPSVAHHRVFLIIERVENFHGIQSAHRFYLDKKHGLFQRDNAPVARAVGHDSAKIIFYIHELDTRFYIIFMVNAQHQSRLVKTCLVITGYFYFHLKFSTVNP